MRRVVLVLDSPDVFVVVRLIEVEHFLIVRHLKLVVLFLHLVFLKAQGMVFLELPHILVGLQALRGESNLVKLKNFRAQKIGGSEQAQEANNAEGFG